MLNHKTNKMVPCIYLSEKSLKKAGLLNPHGVAVNNVQDKIQFSNARPWGTVEDDHKPFMERRWGKTYTTFFLLS